ncbi:RNase PH-like protein [Novymonas esmeraldas]|uniref:RNase PH-like protein n=1 Tax=Novymonas esmeraldas TaxID=1808958 RepID=A0AAW0EXH8_9TRYP
MQQLSAHSPPQVSAPPAPAASYARRDGRTALEIRGKEMKLSEMAGFDGSSWYAQGQTAVSVCIHGPTAARSEEYDVCTLHVRVQHARGRAPSAGGAEKVLYEECKLSQLTRVDALALESLLESSLHAVFMRERYPRCVLVVDVVVVADDGSLPAVALNALMCALLDAGLPCRTTMAAVCVAAVTRGGGGGGGVTSSSTAGSAPVLTYLLDPTSAEEALGTSSAAPTAAASAQMSILDHAATQQQAQEDFRCVSTGVFVFSNPACGGGLLAQLVRRVGGASGDGTRNGGGGGETMAGLSVAAYAEMMTLAERAAAVLFDFFRQCNVAD